MRGRDVVPTRVEIDEGLAARRAGIPDRVTATAEAFTGPKTPDGAHVKVHNAPGAEVGPGQVATWGRAAADRANAFGFSWERSGKSSKYFPSTGAGPTERKRSSLCPGEAARSECVPAEAGAEGRAVREL